MSKSIYRAQIIKGDRRGEIKTKIFSVLTLEITLWFFECLFHRLQRRHTKASKYDLSLNETKCILLAKQIQNVNTLLP